MTIPSSTLFSDWPEGNITDVPYWVYQRQDIFSREQERIYQGAAWNYLCLASELSEIGDYVFTYVGRTPVLVTRGEDKNIYAFENRCAHRGALLTTQPSGKTDCFVCVYHAWKHNLEGDLTDVTFESGVNGQGGMPAGFDKNIHHPRKLRTTAYEGLVFGTFDENTSDFPDFIGQELENHIHRVIRGRTPIKIGQYTQRLPYNWKLYFENVKDSYHASILHLFFTTFGLNRLNQTGGLVVSQNGACHVSYAQPVESDATDLTYKEENLRSESDYRLSAPEFIKFFKEFDDAIQLQILSIAPGFVLQQIRNTIAVRQLVPVTPDETNLNWTFIGFKEDSEEQHEARRLQCNLVGPAGFVSMEDGYVGSLVQEGIEGASNFSSVIKMGGVDAQSVPYRATETGIRGFWKLYRNLMKI